MDEWGDEKQLPMNINSNDDDNYPFVLSDGATIYYSSKGNGSIGGYDLFVTRYNINSDTYLAPEQLGMPFNSPYNDYMMVFDEVKGLGWFVSDRFQPEGKACVYLFIPNPEHKRVESEDIEMKRTRAAITSIRDSWKEGSDYTDLIRLSHTEIPYGEEKIEKDFEFIIAGNIVYYKLDEINSPEAKSYYEKVVALNKQIKELNEKLDGLRTSYVKGNTARKEQLKPTILQAEEQLNALLEQPGELEKKARNAEINYLKTNDKTSAYMIFETFIIAFLMVVAIVLILLEIFMLPGITVAGVGGFLFAAGGLIYAYSVGTPVGNVTLAVSLLVFVASFVWLLRSKSFNRVALKTDIDSKLVSSRDLGIVPGDEGLALSRLAPIGKARINGIMVEAKSVDELIDENTPVEVIRVDGYNVIVKIKS